MCVQGWSQDRDHDKECGRKERAEWSAFLPSFPPELVVTSAASVPTFEMTHQTLHQLCISLGIGHRMFSQSFIMMCP